jgi:hypothetical protein
LEVYGAERMLKSATALLTALTAGWVLFGFQTTARADGDCEPCKPTTEYRHEHKVVEKDVTVDHYKNVDKSVPVRHTIVTIIEVTPIKHVHEVWHVTIHKVPKPYYVHDVKTVVRPEIVKFDTRTITRVVGCGCRHHD